MAKPKTKLLTGVCPFCDHRISPYDNAKLVLTIDHSTQMATTKAVHDSCAFEASIGSLVAAFDTAHRARTGPFAN